MIYFYGRTLLNTWNNPHTQTIALLSFIMKWKVGTYNSVMRGKYLSLFHVSVLNAQVNNWYLGKLINACKTKKKILQSICKSLISFALDIRRYACKASVLQVFYFTNPITHLKRAAASTWGNKHQFWQEVQKNKWSTYWHMMDTCSNILLMLVKVHRPSTCRDNNGKGWHGFSYLDGALLWCRWHRWSPHCKWQQ